MKIVFMILLFITMLVPTANAQNNAVAEVTRSLAVIVRGVPIENEFHSISSETQSNLRIDKYRTMQTAIFLNDGTIEWHDTDFLVSITSKDNIIQKVNIYAKQEEQYDIISYNNYYYDSNKIPWGVFSCLNNDGERYTLEHGVFLNGYNGHIYTLKFINKDGNGLIYKLKRN